MMSVQWGAEWEYPSHHPEEQNRSQAITEPRRERHLTLRRVTPGRRAPSALRLRGLVHEINRVENHHTAFLRIPAGSPE